ncbi:hypothetical protein D3C75_843230 [compost metagenome]
MLDYQLVTLESLLLNGSYVSPLQSEKHCALIYQLLHRQKQNPQKHLALMRPTIALLDRG